MKNTTETPEVITNALNVNALSFDIDALDAILKDVRNARRAVLAIETGQEEAKVKSETAKTALQHAIDTSDLEGMTKYAGELKNAMRKLAEKPDEKIQAFDSAINKLVQFTSVSAETPTLKVAA